MELFEGLTMKVLLVGSGAKESTLASILVKNPNVEFLFCAPGSLGISEYADCIDIRASDIEGLLDFAVANEIDITIPCSDQSISVGITDLFQKNGLNIFAPTQEASKIAISKAFGKKFMYKNKILTPKFGVFEKEAQALDYARKNTYPIVIKTDNHLVGQNTVICDTFPKARQAIEKAFAGLNKRVIIEDFIEGKEVSFYIISDGYNVVPLPPVATYKRVLDGNGGAVAAGMGAYAPAMNIDFEMESKIAQKIIFPTIDGLQANHTPYTGILGVDIIIDKNNNVYVLEYNSFLNDPDSQVLLPLINDDILQVFYSAINGALGDEYEFLDIDDSYNVSIVATSGNYPLPYKKGFVIDGLESVDEATVVHYNTKKNIYGELLTDGGRVLSVTASASTLGFAKEKAYEQLDFINFKNMKYRTDIAKSTIKI